MQVDITLDSFLSKVQERNTNPNGTLIEPSLMRRFDNPICRKCHETYKAKFPDKPFMIKCSGIYDEQDFLEKQQELHEMFPEDELMPIESPTGIDIREIFDVPYWANKHIRTKDNDGQYVPFVARDYQEEALKCTASQKVDRWARGLGKAEHIEALIPTTVGFKKMKDLAVGDYVFSELGEPIEVLSKTDVMYGRLCYKVVFSDNSECVVDAEHLWETWTHNARQAHGHTRIKRRTGKLSHTRFFEKPKVVTTQEIKNTLLHGNGKRIEHNHSIKVCKAVKYSEKLLPIEPYTLGVWLGDGDAAGNGLTSDFIDKEVRDNIFKLSGFYVNKLLAKQKYSIGTNEGFTSLLKGNNLLKNKHIPAIYLLGSQEQRLAIVQGLMDTDGTISKSGNCTFDNTNRELADGLYDLLVSLGIKVTRKERYWKLYGVTKKLCYRLNFTTDIEVFKLKRKLARLPKVLRLTQNHRYIVSVEPIESVPVQCITVDNPTHLYLTGKSFITTHNSSVGLIEELHKVCQNTGLDLLVVCPADTQSNSWYEGFLEYIDHSDTLRDIILERKQNPYRMIKFNNGSVVRIVTAGSASGRKASSLRGLTPRRVRIDEQDYLVEADWGAISPLLTRYENSEFHGSSTPTGDRSKFWEMCTQDPRYREFYNPIFKHPNWSVDMEMACRADARTEDRYRFEFLAEFGDPTQGVFKGMYIDIAKVPYKNSKYPSLKGYDTCQWEDGKEYFMGVDWNGQGTGTRIRVVEYDRATTRIKVVGAYAVSHLGFTVFDSINAIEKYNKQWHCKKIYVDAGYGASQFDMLRKRGLDSLDSDTRKLRDVISIDFGGKLSFNGIISKRNTHTRYKDQEEFDTRTKPYMVEGAVMMFEQRKISFSDTDKILEDQLRAYRVASYSKGGRADTYKADSGVGDHDLDAFMLALLAVELEHGLYSTPDIHQRLANVSFMGAFGFPAEVGSSPQQNLDNRKILSGVPSRTNITNQNKDQYRIAYLQKNSISFIPGKPGTERSTSRTKVFGERPTRSTRNTRGR